MAPSSEKKFEVDDLVVTGATVQVVINGVGSSKPQVLTLPDIHMTDLGTGGDGITVADLTSRILSAISSATLQTVAQTAVNLDKNAANLKQIKQNGVNQMGSTLSNLFNK
jgi:hypothetical protein